MGGIETGGGVGTLGGGGRGSDINWVGSGCNVLAAWIRRVRAKEATYRALEAELAGSLAASPAGPQ